MTDNPDPYDVIDPILMPWARRHGIGVRKIYRDDPVRSIWTYDKNGDPRGHMWAELLDTQGNVTIVASAVDPTSPTKCGAREERHASLETLEVALEELRPIMLGWAGEGGAFGG